MLPPFLLVLRNCHSHGVAGGLDGVCRITNLLAQQWHGVAVSEGLLGVMRPAPQQCDN
jgi:hypothetical protein